VIPTITVLAPEPNGHAFYVMIKRNDEWLIRSACIFTFDGPTDPPHVADWRLFAVKSDSAAGGPLEIVLVESGRLRHAEISKAIAI
jgi:hypothetical protein